MGAPGARALRPRVVVRLLANLFGEGAVSPPGRPIRVLAVDHTAGVLPFRRKFAALATLPGIELTVLAPDRWVENYRSVHATALSKDGYRLGVGGVIWPGYEN